MRNDYLQVDTILTNNKGVKYRIIRFLQQNAVGITYLAEIIEHPLYNVDAVPTVTKIIKEFFLRSINERDASGAVTGMQPGSLPEYYKRKYAARVTALRELKHPHLPIYEDLFEANNTCYYVSSHISGTNLKLFMSNNPLMRKPPSNICQTSPMRWHLCTDIAMPYT